MAPRGGVDYSRFAHIGDEEEAEEKAAKERDLDAVELPWASRPGDEDEEEMEDEEEEEEEEEEDEEDEEDEEEEAGGGATAADVVGGAPSVGRSGDASSRGGKAELSPHERSLERWRASRFRIGWPRGGR